MANKKIGVELTAEGQQQFFSVMKQATQHVQDFGEKAKGIATHLTGFGSASDTASSKVKNLGSQSETASGGIGKIHATSVLAMGALLRLGEAAVSAGGNLVKNLVGGSLKTFGDFQENINMLGAVSGASAEDMKRISDQAKALGADLTLPNTSASDAAQAMLELSKAGLSVKDTMAAAKGVLQLSAAGQLSNADAAEITANALNAFSLSGENATEIANMLAAAANSSSMEVKDVGDGFKMAASVFSSFQGPAVGAKGAATELTAALAILGNAGIKGSDAGTSLKQMLLQLTGPSDKAKALMQGLARNIGISGDIAFDATGKMRPLREIIDLTAKSTAGMTEEQRDYYLTTIFGSDASRAIIALMKEGTDGFDKMTGAVTKAGAASDLANSRMAGLKGAMEGLKSQWETFLLAVGELIAPAVEKAVRWLSVLVSKATDALPKVVGAFQGAARSVKEAVEPIFKGFELGFKGDWIPSQIKTLPAFFATMGHDLHVTFDKIVDSIHAFKAGFTGEWVPDKVRTIPAFFARMGSNIKGSLDKLAGYFKAFKDGFTGGLLPMEDLRGIPKLFTDLGEKARDAFDTVHDLIFNRAIPAFEALWPKIQPVLEAGWKIYEAFSPIANVFKILEGLANGGAQGGMDAIGGIFQNIVSVIQTQAPVILEALGQLGQKFVDWIGPMMPQILASLGQFGSQVLTWIGQVAPQIGQQLLTWGKQFIDWIAPQIPGLLQQAGQLAGQLIDWIGQQIPKIVEQLARWGKEFIDWIIPQIPKIFEALGQLGGQLIAWLGEQIPKITDQLMKWGSSFLDWITKDVLPKLLPELDKIGQNILQFILDKGPEFAGKLIEWGSKFLMWIQTEVMPKLGDALLQIANETLKFIGDSTIKIGAKLLEWVDAFLKWIGETVRKIPGELMNIIHAIGQWISDGVGWALGEAARIGKAIIDGIVNGIGSGLGAIKDAVTKAIGDPIGFAKNLLGIHSPSKVFQEIGENVVKGFALGLDNAAPEAVIATGDMLNPVVEQAKALADEAAKTGHDIPNDMSFYMQASKGVLAGTLGELTDTVKKAFGEMKNVTHNLGNELPESLVMGAKGSLGPFQGALDDIVKAAKKAASDANAALGSISLAGGGGSGIKHETDVQPFGAGGTGRAEAPHFAGGGYMKRTGWAFVGENGPELAWLGAGSRVFDSGASRQMVAPPASAQQIYNSASYSYNNTANYNLTVNSALQSGGVVNDFYTMKAMAL